MTTHPNFLYGIPDFLIEDIIEHGDTLLIIMYAPFYAPPSPPCPNCGSAHPYYKHTAQERRCRDVKQDNKLVQLLLKVPRHKCRECDYVIPMDVEAIVGPKERYTKRLKKEIQRLTLTRPFAEVGREYDISTQMAKNLFLDKVRELDEKWIPYSPEVLGIDEAHLGASHKTKRIFGTFVDLKTAGAPFLEMTPNRSKETVTQYLRSLPNNHEIKVVVMDMWQPYRAAVCEVLPDALIVADRFHVVLWANNAVTAVRRSVQAALNKRTATISGEIRAAKKTGDLIEVKRLQAHKKSLSKDYDLLKNRYNAGLLTSNREDVEGVPVIMGVLNEIFAKFPNIKLAYDLKERIRALYDITSKTRKQAEDEFIKWRDDIPDEDMFIEFHKLKRGIDNWFAEVFNFYVAPIGNGRTESINKIIKDAYASGNGYSFDVLRYKVKYRTAAYRNDPKFVKLNKNGDVMKMITALDHEFTVLLGDYLTGKGLPEGYKLEHGSGIRLDDYEKAVSSGQHWFDEGV